MQTIVLMMRRKPAAQGLIRKLRDSGESLRLACEPDYARACEAIRAHAAGVALIEIAECGEYNAAYCLALCARLRRQAPGCKLLLMCPEQDTAAVSQAVQAKRDGRIDDFVFYDSTIEYLASKLLSL